MIRRATRVSVWNMNDLALEREIFQSSVELPVWQRSDFVRKACEGKPSLELRILRLLAAHEKAVASALRSDSGPFRSPDTPRQIGPYKLLQILGEGGMGAVYEAEQTEPVHRRVALKIVKQGMHTAQIAARFEAERQALAVMDHPGIAKVFDGGIAPTGQPYFVMELVRGLPLTEYCDRHRIILRQRLELFLLLCDGIQHAHQKGIIHRDLKPSNVLVAMRDGRPIPTVIDFGISKALGPALTKMTLVTLHGQALGTPAYMSPEQADAGATDIDTRSDVYSLGLMLYELLVGRTPMNSEEIGVHEYLAKLSRREIDPPPPSALLARFADHAKDIAALRGTDVSTLIGDLQGDLDWVVMKAIEKDRTRRYETAKSLADDIKRFLNSEPILARPPTSWYRLRKFAKRNRAGVVTAAAVAMALVIGAAATGIGLLRATRAERQGREEMQRAQKAEQAAVERLRESLIAQARANRRNREPGRRFLTLDLLSRAGAIRTGADVRDEAVAAMALTDLKVATEWKQLSSIVFDRLCRRYLTAVDGDRLELRSVSDGRTLTTIPGVRSRFLDGRFSPDGNYVAVKFNPNDGASLRVWDLQSGKPNLESHESISGRAMDFDATSQLLATATSDGWVRIREFRSGLERSRFRLKLNLNTMRFRPDGRALALAPESGDIEIRDLSGRMERKLKHSGPTYALDWNHDGRYLAAGHRDRTATVWDVASGEKVATFRGHQAEVVDVFLSPTANIAVTYSWDETSRLWDVMTGEELLVMGSQAKALSEEGRKLAFTTGSTAGVLEVLHADFLHFLKGHAGKSPNALAIRRDGQVLASAGADGTLLWDLVNDRLLGSLPSGPSTDLYFEQVTGRLFTCGEKGLVRWSYAITEHGLAETKGEPFSAPCVRSSISANGSTIAYTQAGQIKVLPSESGHTPRVIEGFRGLAMLSVSPDGRWLAGGNWRGTQARTWDLVNGKPVADLVNDTPSVSVRFSPGGKWLVAGTSQDYRIWRTSSWEEIRRIPRTIRLSNLPGIMDIAADETMMALLMNQKLIQIFQPETGNLLLSLEPPATEAFSALLFTPDQTKLLAATHGNRIFIWELRRIREQLKALGIPSE
jgi:serine/threonine protein kinase/WD40 repeat protein